MKKRMIAGLLFLVLTVSGCSAVSTAPTKMNEPVKENRAEAETESTDSIFPTESKETDAPWRAKPQRKRKSQKTRQYPKQRHHSRLRKKPQKLQSLRQ